MKTIGTIFFLIHLLIIFIVDNKLIVFFFWVFEAFIWIRPLLKKKLSHEWVYILKLKDLYYLHLNQIFLNRLDLELFFDANFIFF